MAKPSHLELFERAYRRRSEADGELLKQVFGEAGLEELAATKPGLVETARSYFPHLTSSTYERLCREPDTLQLEKARCEREMEQLAIQNYGAFIGSAKVTHAVRQEVVSVRGQLEEIDALLAPMEEDIAEFQKFSNDLVGRRGALRNVLQQHNSLLELLELPQLLDACVRSQMYEESLELLTYCGNMLQAHEARGEEIPVLTKLKEQVAVQRANLINSLVAQLATDIHLPACVRAVGFLRRARRFSEDELKMLFIQHRGSFLDKQRQQIEVLRSSRGSIVTALKNAADLLRTHVYDIGTQYQALFQQDDGPLVPWLNEQIAWLTALLRAHVLPEGAPGSMPAASPMAAGRRPSIGGSIGGFQIDAGSLMMVQRQCMQASTALRRLGGHFFPAVASIFSSRLEHHIADMFDVAILTFQSELGRYDWIPSTALTSSAATATPSATPAAAAGWLHPQALDLTRHRPIAVFANDLIQVFNEVRQCPLHALRSPLQERLLDCLAGAVNLLRAAKGSQTVLVAPAKTSEFVRACRQFADILVPLIASHVEVVFGGAAHLDVSELVASMSPDLVPLDAPVAEAARSRSPDSVPLDAPAAEAAAAEAPDAKVADAPDDEGEPAVPAVHAVPAVPAAPVASVVPAVPVDNTAPAAPVAPIVPAVLFDNTAPAAPVAPVVPAVPVDSTAPAAPIAPVVPAVPADNVPASPAALTGDFASEAQDVQKAAGGEPGHDEK